MLRTQVSIGLAKVTWLTALILGMTGGLFAAAPPSIDLPQAYHSAGCDPALDGTLEDPDPLTPCATPEVDDACLTECTPLGGGMGSYWCVSAIYHSNCIYPTVPGCDIFECTCRHYDNQTCTNPWYPEIRERNGCW
jgi:hypothetical protein